MGSKILFFIFSFIFFQSAITQNGLSSKHKLGFSFTHGSQLALGVSYDYKVNIAHIYYFRKLISKKNWGIDALVNPQFGVSQFLSNPADNIIITGQEIGLNVGVMIRKNIIKDNLHLYLTVSAGPHYISEAFPRQAPGFIFSEYVVLGFLVKCDSNQSLFLGTGIRHLSNAQLKSPNRGINNSIFQLGLLINL